MPMSRRSGRLTGARTRYTDDAFEAAGLSDSDASSDQPAQGAGRTRKGRQDDSDSEFDEIQDDGAHSGEEDEEEYVDQEAEDDDVVEEETGLSSASDIEEDVKRGSLTRRQLSEARRQRDEEMLAAHPDETHSRGVWAPNEHVGKIVHLKLSFGTDMRDLLAMIYTRDRWYLGLDSTMPSRNTLNQPTPDYGLGSTFGLDPADLEREATAGWDWYYDDDKGTSFRERQRVESIDEGKARQKYFIRPKKEQHKVRIGPPMEPENLQKLYTLRQNEVLDFGEAWKNVEPPLPSKNRGRKRKNAAVNDSASTNNGAEEPATNRKPARSGWIINLGGKIQSLGWAPNQEGPTQYLAVSVPISKEQEAEYPPETEPKVSPAFARSEPYPCALQIWSFEATESEGLTRTTDMTKEPRLRLALCTEWGHIRKIDWCPMPRRKREDDKDGSHDLGLVACVCGDGSTRVLDVKVNEKAKAPEFRRMHEAAFTATPPSTVSACMTWLSPSDIAVGCANGFVAVYNIATSYNAETNGDPAPYISVPIHLTYILNIESAYPQHPSLVATTSMDGNTRLTSLLDPHKDTTDAGRMRMGSPHIMYSPLLQAFFSNDENDYIRAFSVRRFYTTTSVGRLPSTVSAIASSSRWHPSTMFGCTAGIALVTNPFRRVLHSKETHYHLKWFMHEWVEGKNDSADISRFQDGFLPESASLLRGTTGDERVANGVMVITIYDENMHITTMAWNPNQRYSGWAVAGMGCGLLRMEDIALGATDYDI